MKTLWIVRHAKSSWDEPGLADYDRPLNKRGLRDAPEMGRRLAERGVQPAAIVSSPAVRAAATAHAIAEQLDFEIENIHWDEDIYHASVEELLDVISRFNSAWPSAMLVGHNPGLTDLVNQLAPFEIDNLPTCGVAELAFSADDWTDVAEARAAEGDFDYPKKGKQ